MENFNNIYQYKRDIESNKPSVEEINGEIIFHLDRFNHVSGVIDNKEKKTFGKVVIKPDNLFKDLDTQTFFADGYQVLPNGEKSEIEITGYLTKEGEIYPRKGCGLFPKGFGETFVKTYKNIFLKKITNKKIKTSYIWMQKISTNQIYKVLIFHLIFLAILKQKINFKIHVY